MKEELRQKYEDISWSSATESIDSFLELGEIESAKKIAREAINNWEEEEKTEIINKFKAWLQEKKLEI